jgi:hypothetical protein
MSCQYRCESRQDAREVCRQPRTSPTGGVTDWAVDFSFLRWAKRLHECLAHRERLCRRANRAVVGGFAVSRAAAAPGAAATRLVHVRVRRDPHVRVRRDAAVTTGHRRCARCAASAETDENHHQSGYEGRWNAIHCFASFPRMIDRHCKASLIVGQPVPDITETTGEG